MSLRCKRINFFLLSLLTSLTSFFFSSCGLGGCSNNSSRISPGITTESIIDYGTSSGLISYTPSPSSNEITGPSPSSTNGTGSTSYAYFINASNLALMSFMNYLLYQNYYFPMNRKLKTGIFRFDPCFHGCLKSLRLLLRIRPGMNPSHREIFDCCICYRFQN